MSPEVCSTNRSPTRRCRCDDLDRWWDDVDATTSIDDDYGNCSRRRKPTRTSDQSSYDWITSVVRNKIFLPTVVDDWNRPQPCSPDWLNVSNTGSKNRPCTLTISTIPQFNLTKTEHHRLEVRWLMRTFSYEEVDVRLYNWSPWNLLFESLVMMSWLRHHHINIRIWLAAAVKRSADDPPATANEEVWKWTPNDDITVKRLWNDDCKCPVVNRLSHKFKNTLYITSRQTISIE
jgi:hypothetical protein